MTNESVDYAETVNLFNVSMGKGLEGLNQYYEKAVKFQNDLQEKLGVNIAESMNYQALFNSMSKSMGISAKYAYTLSENFTKLGYDLASLYNIDPSNAMQKLRAGLAGQTKPLRDLGLDITQQSLQPIVDSLGIDRSVKDMSQAEKMILRYIAVLNQAKIAQGDFANTMDSPANQLRIFNAQVTAFKRNMGNLWQGLLGGILPYVNAIMMVINELLKMVAKLFGFEVPEQKVNISASVGADDLASDLGNAGKKAKELKAQLMGFDEINNISLPDNSSGGSGSSGGGVGGIDKRLLDAMKEYDNLMDKVKNKATDIRDKIMKWLGFTKKINPLTGEISWEYTGMSKQAETILNILKLIAGLYIGAKALKLIGYLRTLKGVIKGTITPTTSFQNGLSMVSKGLKNTGTWLKLGVEQFKLYRNAGDGVVTSLGKTSKAMFDLIPNTVKVAGGIVGLVSSCTLAYKSMEDLSNGTIGTNEAILKLTGSIAGATVSGALIGSVFGPAGTAIGAIAGLAISATSAFIGYKDETDKLCESISNGKEETDKYIQSIQEQKQAIQDSVNSQLAQIDYTQNLVNELETLVDENGKVKDGYEDRVKFILSQLSEATGEEWNLTNGTIEKYQELRSEINKVINTKKAEIILNANQEEYANAIGRQIELQHRKAEEQQKLNDITKTYNEKLQEINEKYGSLEEAKAKATFSNEALWDVEKLKGYGYKVDEAKASVDSLTKQITEDNQMIIMWEDLKTATITGNTDEINAKVQEITNTYKTEAGNQVGTLTEQLTKETDLAKERQKVWEENGIEINETRKTQLETGIRTIADKLVEQTKKVETLGEDEIEAWKTLATNSRDIYNEKISQVNEDTRLALEAITGSVDITSPDYINKWANLASTSKDRYNQALSSLDDDTAKEIQSAVNEINAKTGTSYNAGYDLGYNANKGASDGAGDPSQLGKDFGEGYAEGILGSINKAVSATKRMVKASVAQAQLAQDSHSPSKVTRKLGNDNGMGYALGIQDMIPKSIKSAKEMANKTINSFKNTIKPFSISEEIGKINPQDFMIDTRQFIDYGTIAGNINTQAKVEMRDLPQEVKQAVIEGMRNAKIKVEVEGKADKDGIFKVVQTGAEEYAMQTGESPFPVMA